MPVHDDSTGTQALQVSRPRFYREHDSFSGRPPHHAVPHFVAEEQRGSTELVRTFLREAVTR